MLTRNLDTPLYTSGLPGPVATAHHVQSPQYLAVSPTPTLNLPGQHIAQDPSDRMTWAPGREIMFTGQPTNLASYQPRYTSGSYPTLPSVGNNVTTP